ncbi:hypothetical protein V1478_012635 [Vespula squamosa]|uniref:Uncharacterized protein n=1 Tax=Vespula squamosa TaxID=30214 RepID=A0ABD2AAT4_VESSQ
MFSSGNFIILSQNKYHDEIIFRSIRTQFFCQQILITLCTANVITSNYKQLQNNMNTHNYK